MKKKSITLIIEKDGLKAAKNYYVSYPQWSLYTYLRSHSTWVSKKRILLQGFREITIEKLLEKKLIKRAGAVHLYRATKDNEIKEFSKWTDNFLTQGRDQVITKKAFSRV